jgi:hypothetical protein
MWAMAYDSDPVQTDKEGLGTNPFSRRDLTQIGKKKKTPDVEKQDEGQASGQPNQQPQEQA